MPLDMNDEQKPGILKAARSVIGMAKTKGNRDCLENIFAFIMTVLKQAGFDLERSARTDLDKILQDKIVIMDWFDRISENAAGPGDLLSYTSPANRETLGLIESYDPGTRTGTMYAMDGSTGEVSSIDFRETDIEGAGFLRPKTDLFVGNLTGFFTDMGEEYDEDPNQYIGPSPAPH